MVDAALFGLGFVGGLATLVLGAPLSLIVPLVPALAAGIVDGRRHARLRWLMSWMLALVGSLLVPAWAITRDLFRDPPAPDAGLALSVGLAIVGGYAAAFVVLAWIASAITRALSRSAA